MLSVFFIVGVRNRFEFIVSVGIIGLEFFFGVEYDKSYILGGLGFLRRILYLSRNVVN